MKTDIVRIEYASVIRRLVGELDDTLITPMKVSDLVELCNPLGEHMFSQYNYMMQIWDYNPEYHDDELRMIVKRVEIKFIKATNMFLAWLETNIVLMDDELIGRGGLIVHDQLVEHKLPIVFSEQLSKKLMLIKLAK